MNDSKIQWTDTAYTAKKKTENCGAFNSYPKIARTLPVITTSAERSFSSVVKFGTKFLGTGNQIMKACLRDIYGKLVNLLHLA